MAEVNKEALANEVKDLVAKLRPQFEADKSRIEGEKRPFNALQWVLGTPDNGKYPAGPAYLPIGLKPTLTNCLMMMNAQDVATTVLGGAFFYVFGFMHAAKLGVANGHKLGFWTAVPAIGLGLLGGINKGAYRYAGFMNNGNAPLYPGYIEEGPYFLKHNVSDRVAQVAPGFRIDPTKLR